MFFWSDALSNSLRDVPTDDLDAEYERLFHAPPSNFKNDYLPPVSELTQLAFAVHPGLFDFKVLTVYCSHGSFAPPQIT